MLETIIVLVIPLVPIAVIIYLLTHKSEWMDKPIIRIPEDVAKKPLFRVAAFIVLLLLLAFMYVLNGGRFDEGFSPEALHAIIRVVATLLFFGTMQYLFQKYKKIIELRNR